MDQVAQRAGISRALLYRHFSNKRDLFAAVHQRAQERLIAEVRFDPDTSLREQLTAGLDLHIDYFVANRHAVLAVNRELLGDPVIQAINNDELAVMRDGLLDGGALGDAPRETLSVVVTNWLVFVRLLCVDWLTRESFSREELRDICTGALIGALAPYR